jgi:FRG domain
MVRFRGRYKGVGWRSGLDVSRNLDDWSLETSLERCCGDWGLELSKLPRIEQRILRDFQRRYPAMAHDPAPRLSDVAGWFALMQHHGAPTRFLDWTYSPFIAAYFAFQELLRCKNRRATVWALPREPFKVDEVCEHLPNDAKREYRRFEEGRQGKLFRRLFLEPVRPLCFVAAVNPFKLNERLVIQQGVFLCPGDITKSFEQNLKAMVGPATSGITRKLVISRDVMPEALEQLHRMNISQASLFPGPDGFARQFRYRLPTLARLPLGDA